MQWPDVVMTLHIFDFREIAMMSKGDSTESSNPFAEIEEEDEDADGEVNGDEAESLDVAIPEWLAELPDDLEVTNKQLISELHTMNTDTKLKKFI